MRWKQFLTPVKSMNSAEAKSFMDQKKIDEFTLLDVRQPSEYEKEHIPGAKLIPLPELGDRLEELETDKTILVYCAVGGRSRVAAQMLSGKEFKSVLNLRGGIKAWNSDTALGNEELGITLFTGKESPVDTLVVAYSLEQGLRDFYLSMKDTVQNEPVKKLFSKLAEIEIKHQKSIFNQYLALSDTSPTLEAFESEIVVSAVEGGLTTDEYGKLFNPDWESPVDVISVAMSIEAQALDMYQRVADRTNNGESKKVLLHIAEEERMHLTQLGKLMDSL